MPVTETSSAAVVKTTTPLSLSQFFTVTPSAANAPYVVVCALDRDEYTVTGNGDTGSFSGNGATLGFWSIGGDGNGAGIVFTWQQSTGQYVNAIYGTLCALTYTASDSPNDVTSISLWGTSNASLAQQYADNAYNLMTMTNVFRPLGAVTIATQPAFTAAVPTVATPDGVAAAALSFVGDAWNEDGCWVLASTIAAEAGASLPVQSTAVTIPGHSNGEWVVVYNGPLSTTTYWQSLVTTGDIIDFVTASGGGHITTCVSGTGASAMVVDNVVYADGNGPPLNAANDGSAADILIAAPHPASQEFAGVAANTVVIYALDTPVLTDHSARINLAPGSSIGLSTLFTVSDPAGHAVTEYQAYDTLFGDIITLNGHATSANSAATAASATSLSALGLLSSAADRGDTDTIDVRAYNGSYWGDWQTETVTLDLPPVLGTHTPNQTWSQGMAVNLVLPTTLFTDPQHQALSYSVSGAGTSALPAWLHFNPATNTLTGTVPAGSETFAVTVTATDRGGLSGSETFTVTVPAAAPTLTNKTNTQSWTAGSAVSLKLPANAFTDPQGEKLTYKATQSNGAALPSWLHFAASTLSFSGTAPSTAQILQLQITATDTSGLSASETFAASIVNAISGLMLAGDWTAGAVLPATALPPLPREAAGFLSIAPAAGDFFVLPHHGATQGGHRLA